MFIHEGKEYARVTEILRSLNDFSGIPEDVLKRKADIGTWAHRAIEDEIKGQFPYIPLAFQQDAQGYVDSFLKWYEYVKVEFLETSKRYFDDELMFTGEIDALVKFPGEELPVLLDFKTSANENALVWPRQGHFYHYLLELNDKEIGDRILFMKLNKRGELPKVIQYKYERNIREECLNRAREYWEKKDCASQNITDLI